MAYLLFILQKKEKKNHPIDIYYYFMRRFVIDEMHGGVTVTPALFKPVTAEITARKMGSLNIDFHTWGGGGGGGVHVMSLSLCRQPHLTTALRQKRGSSCVRG